MITAYQNVQSYTGNNTLDTYSFPFKIMRAEEIRIVVINNATEAIVANELGNELVYVESVTFDSLKGGGSIVLDANLPTGYKLYILLDVQDPVQDFRFREQSTYMLREIENGLDNAVKHIQSLTEKVERSLKFGPQSHFKTDLNTQIPSMPVINSLPFLDANMDLQFKDGITALGEIGVLPYLTGFVTDATAEAAAAAASAAAALASQTAAEDAAVLADTSADAAAVSAAAAAASAVDALAALAAQALAEAAQAAAEVAETNAELAELAAETAQAIAEASALAADASADAAALSATAAATSATASATSATNSQGFATASAASATAALASETAALAAENAAELAAADAQAAAAASVANFAVDNFVGDGVTLTLTLSVTPGSVNNTDFFIQGVRQETSTYSLLGNVITLTEAIPLGVSAQVKTGRTATINVPAALSVNTASLQPLAVTAEKIATSVGFFTTGDIKPTYKIVADAGWILANDGSIGSASSGATTRANADTLDLYTHFWNVMGDGIVPVAGGRGLSAAADFAANKAMTIPKTLGRAFGIAGTGAGLTTRGLGGVVGTESEALTNAQMPRHTHVQDQHDHEIVSMVSSLVDGGPSGGWISTTGTNKRTAMTIATNQYTGGSSGTQAPSNGDAHNNMQPTAFVNIMIKL